MLSMFHRGSFGDVPISKVEVEFDQNNAFPVSDGSDGPVSDTPNLNAPDTAPASFGSLTNVGWVVVTQFFFKLLCFKKQDDEEDDSVNGTKKKRPELESTNDTTEEASSNSAKTVEAK